MIDRSQGLPEVGDRKPPRQEDRGQVELLAAQDRERQEGVVEYQNHLVAEAQVQAYAYL